LGAGGRQAYIKTAGEWYCGAAGRLIKKKRMIYLKQNTLLEEIKMSKGSRSSNDQRSDVKNPNNPEYKENQDNRADQLNPNNEDTNPDDEDTKE